MNLVLSSTNVTNAVYSDEAGKAIYIVHTPFRFFGRTSTISRVLPSDLGGPGGGQGDEERFGLLATVEHHSFRSSVIRYGGREIRTVEYFRKVGFGWPHRAFVGPDGRDYKWILGRRSSKLVLNEKEKRPVAKYHKKSYGFIGKAHPAFLEIFPEGVGILDHILVTFIYIEKMRQDSEDAAKRSRGGV